MIKNSIAQTKKPTPWNLFFIILIALAPLAFSVVVFQFDLLNSFKTVNHGELIKPPYHISHFNNEKFHPAEIIGQRRWFIWYVNTTNCQQDCLQILDKLQRVRLVLGKEMPRVKVAITAFGASTKSRQAIQNVAAQNQLSEWILDLKDFEHVRALTKQKQANHIYLVDPRGNIFMSYRENTKPDAIYEDLQRVLFASHIG